MRGIAGMVEDERYCIDVLQQISAAQAALDKVALALVDDHTRHCVLGRGAREPGGEARGADDGDQPPGRPEVGRWATDTHDDARGHGGAARRSSTSAGSTTRARRASSSGCSVAVRACVAVEANPTAQTATVTYDPGRTSLERPAGLGRGVRLPLRRALGARVTSAIRWHGDGTTTAAGHDQARPPRRRRRTAAATADMPACRWPTWPATCATASSWPCVFAIPIVLWSPLGTDVLGLDLGTPFGMDRDVLQLILSLPVVFYSSWIFFPGRGSRCAPAPST